MVTIDHRTDFDSIIIVIVTITTVAIATVIMVTKDQVTTTLMAAGTPIDQTVFDQVGEESLSSENNYWECAFTFYSYYIYAEYFMDVKIYFILNKIYSLISKIQVC